MTISMGVVKRFKGLVQAATTTGNHSLHYRAFEPVYRFFSDKEDAILLPYTHRLKQLQPLIQWRRNHSGSNLIFITCMLEVRSS